MNRLLDLLNWVIRLKQKGEGHDVSKSKEKFKWYSVFLEFIQNTIDSNIKLNQELKKSNQNHKDLPAVIKISFTKIYGSLWGPYGKPSFVIWPIWYPIGFHMAT